MPGKDKRPGKGKEGQHAGKPSTRLLPEPSEVVEEKVIVSSKGNRYRILRTAERDAYEEKGRSDKR
jgi:hypothetical protein